MQITHNLGHLYIERFWHNTQVTAIGRSLPVKHPKTHHVEWLKLHQNQVSSGIKSAHLAKEIAAMEAQKKLFGG